MTSGVRQFVCQNVVSSPSIAFCADPSELSWLQADTVQPALERAFPLSDTVVGSALTVSSSTRPLKLLVLLPMYSTGSTSVAKYCVSAVAQRGEMTLLAVVMGAPDAKVRFKDAAALLDYGFGKCNLYLDENRKNPDPVPIKGGVKAEVSCRYTGEFRYLDTEGKNLSQIEKKIVYMKNLQAPVKKGDIVGEAQYLLDGKVIGKTDIVAAKSVKKAGLWDYIKHIRKRMIKGDDYLADR